MLPEKKIVNIKIAGKADVKASHMEPIWEWDGHLRPRHLFHSHRVKHNQRTRALLSIQSYGQQHPVILRNSVRSRNEDWFPRNVILTRPGFHGVVVDVHFDD